MLEEGERRAGASLARVIDRLIPAQLHAELDSQLRSRVLVFASFGLGLCALAAVVIRVSTFALDPGVLVAVGAMVVIFMLPFIQRATRSHRIAGGLLVGVLLATLVVLHLLRGGFPDASGPIFAIVPLIATFFVGPRFGFVSVAAIAAVLVGLQALLVPASAAQIAEFWWTFVGVTAIVPLMTAVLAAAYERARAQTQGQLAASNLALAEASARADAANRGKTEFVRHVSHELRTPLNAILGYGELIREQLGDEDHPAIADMDALRGASHQLLALINELLDISRAEAGMLDVVIAEVDPIVVLTQVRDTALPLARANLNTLTLVVDEGLPRLRSDEQRLRQILLNLVGNACKFTERGRVEIVVAGAAGELLFRVRDTGVGLTPEQCARIFQPFVQVHESAERRRQGSGLGLTLSRELALRLGGDITVVSEPGRGTEFTLRLPLRATTP